MTPCTTAGFLDTLADHVPDRYRHTIRHFGLLGQIRQGKPRRLSWAASLRKSFGVDPLLDRRGERMRWIGRLKPG